MSDVLTVGRAL